MLKRFTYSLLVLLAVFSCKREEKITHGHGGIITLHFTTDGYQTKAVTPGSTSAEDGGAIVIEDDKPDLVILIADPSTGNIIKRYPGKVGDSDAAKGSLTEFDEREAAVSFDFSDNVAKDYKVYAFANTKGIANVGELQIKNQVLSTKEHLQYLDTSAEVEALEFRELLKSVSTPKRILATEEIELNNNRMPLSAKGTVTVEASKNGDVVLELLRCVAKVSATIINNTGQTIYLFNYHHEVKGIFPDRGYVLPGDAMYPAETGFYNLIGDPSDKLTWPSEYTIWVGLTSYRFVPIADGGSQEYNWFVYPSNGPYKVDLRFRLYKNNAPSTGVYTDFSYTDMAITDWKTQDIPSLERNQHLHVITRLSQGITVSSNFEVLDWGTPIEPSVEFD